MQMAGAGLAMQHRQIALFTALVLHQKRRESRFSWKREFQSIVLEEINWCLLLLLSEKEKKTSLKNKEALEVPYIYFSRIKGLLEFALVKSPVVSNCTSKKVNTGSNIHETEESERFPSLLKTSFLFLSPEIWKYLSNKHCLNATHWTEMNHY